MLLCNVVFETYVPPPKGDIDNDQSTTKPWVKGSEDWTGQHLFGMIKTGADNTEGESTI